MDQSAELELKKESSEEKKEDRKLTSLDNVNASPRTRIRRKSTLLLPDEDHDKSATRRCQPNYGILRWSILLIVILVGVAIADIVMYVWFRELIWGRAFIYLWLLWAAFVIIVLMVTQVLSFLIIKFLRAVMPARAYYFVSEIGPTLGWLMSAIVQIPVWYRIVQDTEPKYYDTTSKVILAVLYVSLARVGKLIFDKVAIVQIQKQNNFWSTLYSVLYREKALRILLHPHKKKKIEAKIDNMERNSRFGPTAAEFKKVIDHFMKPKFLTFEYIERVEISKRVVMAEVVELADKLFKNLGVEKKEYFTMSDIESHFEKKSHAKKAFDIFDYSKNGKATKDETLTAIGEILQDRRKLYNTLHDRESIAGIISKVFGVIFWVLVVIFVLLGFGVDLFNLLLPFATTFLGFAFIFGNSLKNTWEALIFIFNVKPYEVGDRVTWDAVGTALIVKQINLLYTEFYSPDGRLFVIPHSYLVDKPLIQLKRSRDYAIYFNVDVHVSTTNEQIQKLITRIEEWIKADSDTTPWKPPFLWADGLDRLNSIAIGVWAELREINWQSPALYLKPKSRLILAIQEMCRDLGIKYTAPTLPVSIENKKDM